MDTGTALNVLNEALSADIGNLLLVVVLVMALAFVAVIWVFNRSIKNSGGANKGANDVIRDLVNHLGATVDNNTKAMQGIRDRQVATLTAINEVKDDAAAIRTDTDGTQARLREIKAQLDTMGTELAAVRIGVDSIIKRGAE